MELLADARVPDCAQQATTSGDDTRDQRLVGPALSVGPASSSKGILIHLIPRGHPRPTACLVAWQPADRESPSSSQRLVLPATRLGSTVVLSVLLPLHSLPRSRLARPAGRARGQQSIGPSPWHVLPCYLGPCSIRGRVGHPETPAVSLARWSVCETPSWWTLSGRVQSIKGKAQMGMVDAAGHPPVQMQAR